MPFIRIWIHLIWSTKNREPLLTPKIRSKIFSHIRDNAIEKGILVDFINGYKEDVHLLVSMNQQQSISKIVHYLKGESSYWINKNNISQFKFHWQEGYGAFSVSQSNKKSTIEYIQNQNKHHTVKSFKQELRDFFEKYELEYDERYVWD